MEFFKLPLHEFEHQRYKKHGRIFGIFVGKDPVLYVGEPSLLRDILVKDFTVLSSKRMLSNGTEIFDNMLSFLNGGDKWKRIRTIVTPTFSSGKIKKMMSIFTDCSTTLVKNFRTKVSEGKTIDAKSLYGAFSMDVIASSAFSIKIDSHNDPTNYFVVMARKPFLKTLNWKSLVFFICPAAIRLFKLNVIIPTDSMQFFKNVILEIIEERKKTGKVSNDFLQLLMDTAKEVEADFKEGGAKEDITSNYGAHDDINPHIFQNVTSKSLSMDELVAQCVNFFIAAYDTSSSILSVVSYFLALNPDVQEKLRAEVDAALRIADGNMTYEAIKDMKYLDNVISETLRLFPPFPRLERTADVDYTISDTGITVKKGMLIAIPIYGMHMDPKLFPDPEKFDPERFTPEEKAKRDPYAYLPFGAGPRNCVAMRFAFMEIKVCLAHVIANFHIKRCPETKVPLKFNLVEPVLQPQGIILEMEIRKDSPITK